MSSSSLLALSINSLIPPGLHHRVTGDNRSRGLCEASCLTSLHPQWLGSHNKAIKQAEPLGGIPTALIYSLPLWTYILQHKSSFESLKILLLPKHLVPVNASSWIKVLPDSKDNRIKLHSHEINVKACAQQRSQLTGWHQITVLLISAKCPLSQLESYWHWQLVVAHSHSHHAVLQLLQAPTDACFVTTNCFAADVYCEMFHCCPVTNAKHHKG